MFQCSWPISLLVFSVRTTNYPRFLNVSVFNKASHILGFRDFLVLKELSLDWKLAARGWRRLTPEDVNKVRPIIGSEKVSTDVTSPTKKKRQFI